MKQLYNETAIESKNMVGINNYNSIDKNVTVEMPNRLSGNNDQSRLRS